jgi:hypothetical protein
MFDSSRAEQSVRLFFLPTNLWKENAMDVNLGCGQLSDDEFVAAFEECALSPAAFHHADHLRLAWIYAGRCDAAEAEEKLVADPAICHESGRAGEVSIHDDGGLVTTCCRFAQKQELRISLASGSPAIRNFWIAGRVLLEGYAVLLMYSLLQWYWQRIRRPQFNPRTTARALDQLRPTMSVILIFCQGYVARLAPLEYQELLTLKEEARLKILAKTRRLRRGLSHQFDHARAP